MRGRELRMGEDESSLNDLQEVKADPFSVGERVRAWVGRDSFRSIKLGVVAASVLLTVALIFDSKLGNGPIAQHGAVTSSNAICSAFGGEHLRDTRNSYDAAILTRPAFEIVGSQCLN